MNWNEITRWCLIFSVLVFADIQTELAAQQPATQPKHPQNDLYCDFIGAKEPASLEHPISNGKYSITLNMGDEDDLLEGIKVSAEGIPVGPAFDSMAGEFSFVDRFGSSDTPTSFDVEINDGRLSLELSAEGGRKNRWALNQMTIRSISDKADAEETSLVELLYDFGTAKSPVQTGYVGVSPEKRGPFAFSNNVTAVDRKVISGVFADRFTALEFSTSSQKYGDRIFHYRLYEPQPPNQNGRSEPSQRDHLYPLVVWLHGYGDGGSNNQSQLRWLKRFFFDTGLTDKYMFYILAVQCPPDDRYWTNDRSQVEPEQIEDMADICILILDQTVDQFPIDESRIYLSGLSSGGTGAWNMAGKYPESFAAVMPISSSAADRTMLANIGSVPVWAFGNKDDEVAPLEQVVQNVNTVNENGGNAHFTAMEDSGHIAYPFEYAELEAGDWLFSKRRGDFAWWLPPGTQPSQWPLGSIVKFVWPRFRIPLLAVATICLVWVRWKAKRRQQTTSSAKSQ